MPGKHRNRVRSYGDSSRPRGTRLTHKERVEILTLFNLANWNKTQIARKLQLPLSTVRACISAGITTPPTQHGRPILLTTQKRRRLVARATTDAFHRRMPVEEIAQIEGIQACRRTLLSAFEKERYFRRVAAEKPLLTPAHRAARLTWARIHINWDFNMWKRVVWTDESSFTTGGFGKVHVTRKAEEKYLDECLVAKFRGYSS